jgi:hypothetical protein
MGITAVELCQAAQDTVAGLAADLGGGVYKKRLNRNLHRSIFLAKGGQRLIYVHLFAKQDKANITRADLAEFRQLATIYAALTDNQLRAGVTVGQLKEIWCDQESVQEPRT